MGEQPSWYRLSVAARFMGVSPWELEAQPLRFILEAEAAMVAEAEAEHNRSKVGR
jgi:hypothetical protein